MVAGETFKKFAKAAERKKGGEENPAPAKPRPASQPPEGRVEFIKVAPPAPSRTKSVDPKPQGFEGPALKKSRTGSQSVIRAVAGSVGPVVPAKGRRSDIEFDFNPTPRPSSLSVGPQNQVGKGVSSIVDGIEGDMRLGRRGLPKSKPRPKSLARSRGAGRVAAT